MATITLYGFTYNSAVMGISDLNSFSQLTINYPTTLTDGSALIVEDGINNYSITYTANEFDPSLETIVIKQNTTYGPEVIFRYGVNVFATYEYMTYDEFNVPQYVTLNSENAFFNIEPLVTPPPPLPELGPKPVEVDFNIDVTANNAFTIFGESFTLPDQDVIVAVRPLPVNTLYDGASSETFPFGKGLIQFAENPADDQDFICGLATDASINTWVETSSKFVRGIQKVLCDEFDCSLAAPFNNDLYKNDSGQLDSRYYKQRDFSRVAIATLSHYIFGHIDATAAISNDKAFMKNMLSLDNSDAVVSNVLVTDASTNRDNALARYSEWLHEDLKTTPGQYDAEWIRALNSSYTSNTDDALLAIKLGKAMVSKGVTSLTADPFEYRTEGVKGASDESLAKIVSQVITQDSGRSVKLGGGVSTPGTFQLLRFYPGDILYLKIRVKKPTVSINSNKVLSADIDGRYPQSSEKLYTVKITLGPSEEGL